MGTHPGPTTQHTHIGTAHTMAPSKLQPVLWILSGSSEISEGTDLGAKPASPCQHRTPPDPPVLRRGVPWVCKTPRSPTFGVTAVSVLCSEAPFPPATPSLQPPLPGPEQRQERALGKRKGRANIPQPGLSAPEPPSPGKRPIRDSSRAPFPFQLVPRAAPSPARAGRMPRGVCGCPWQEQGYLEPLLSLLLALHCQHQRLGAGQ